MLLSKSLHLVIMLVLQCLQLLLVLLQIVGEISCMLCLKFFQLSGEFCVFVWMQLNDVVFVGDLFVFLMDLKVKIFNLLIMLLS